MLVKKAPISTKFRELSTSTTRVNDDVLTRDGRLLELFTTDADLHFRWSEDPLRVGDFGSDEGDPIARVRTVWRRENGDVDGDFDVEGERLVKGGPWREVGTVGAITLNKTSVLAGGNRDAKMALDDAATRLAQMSWFPLLKDVAQTLHFSYIQSNLTDTIDFAIRYWDGTAWKYWDGVSAWTTETWITAADSATEATVDEGFTPEVTQRHEVLFRPTSAAAGQTAQVANVYISHDALVTDPKLPSGHTSVYRAEGEGRFSFLKGASTGKVTIAEVGAA